MLFWDDGNSHGEGENQRGMTVGNNLLKQNSWKKLFSLETGVMALILGMKMLKLKKVCLKETM